jgi:hypothetical protein
VGPAEKEKLSQATALTASISPLAFVDPLNFFFLFSYLGLLILVSFFLFSLFLSLFLNHFLLIVDHLFTQKSIQTESLTMSGVQPVAFYAVEVPPGGIMVPSLPRGAVAMVSSPCLTQ